MNIMHVINSMSTACGGPALTTLLTLRGLRNRGIDARLFTNQMRPGEHPVSVEPFIHYLPFPRFYDTRFGYSAAFDKVLKESSVADIYHIQGIWQYPGYATVRYAMKVNRPYLITLHGTLYPEALAHSSFKKKTSMFLFQRRQLQQAACIHATCIEEMEHYRSLGFTNPVAVLPYPMECSPKMTPAYSDGEIRIGYLGRVHPRKRIDRLMDVWRRLNEPGELLIMGDGDPLYMQFLKEKVKTLQLNRVRFTGFVTGDEKKRLLASLTCLVVPSDFENCGIITPEALLQETPVIATTGSPWQELNTHACGWWVHNDVETLTGTLMKVLSLDKKSLHEMGKRGRQLVLDKYSVDVVSLQMEDLYGWIAGKKDRPDFVCVK